MILPNLSTLSTVRAPSTRGAVKRAESARNAVRDAQLEQHIITSITSCKDAHMALNVLLKGSGAPFDHTVWEFAGRHFFGPLPITGSSTEFAKACGNDQLIYLTIRALIEFARHTLEHIMEVREYLEDPTITNDDGNVEWDDDAFRVVALEQTDGDRMAASLETTRADGKTATYWLNQNADKFYEYHERVSHYMLRDGVEMLIDEHVGGGVASLFVDPIELSTYYFFINDDAQLDTPDNRDGKLELGLGDTVELYDLPVSARGLVTADRDELRMIVFILTGQPHD